jgi:hypothetical protein
MPSPATISLPKLTRLDALHLWCRDAAEEAHDWPSAKGARA